MNWALSPLSPAACAHESTGSQLSFASPAAHGLGRPGRRRTPIPIPNTQHGQRPRPRPYQRSHNRNRDWQARTRNRLRTPVI